AMAVWSLRVALAIGLFLSLSACSDGSEAAAASSQGDSATVSTPTAATFDQADPAARAAELEDTLWIYRSGLDVEPIDGLALTLLFQMRTVSKFVANGHDGCNDFGASYRAAEQQIFWDPQGFSIEDGGCDPLMTEVGAGYLAALVNVHTFERNNATLSLRGAGFELIFDAEEAIDESQLVGDYWLLDVIVVNGADRDVQGTSGYLRFVGETFTASTGCRSLTGTWTRPAGNLIKLPNQRASGSCSPELLDQDRLVMDVLSGGFSVDVLTAEVLRVSSEGNQALVFRRSTDAGAPPEPDVRAQFGFEVAEGEWFVVTPTDQQIVSIYQSPDELSFSVAEAGPDERMIAVSTELREIDGVVWRQVQTDALATGWIRAEHLRVQG
ncbi:MAG: META domain-containing protein, partial [Acidimicrobiales bacterium]